MPKFLFFTFLIFFITSSVFAQSDPTNATITPAPLKPRPKAVKSASDFLMLQFTYEGYAQKPDSIKTTGFGRGFNVYANYDFPIKNSNFSFSAGIGLGTSNIYFDKQVIQFTDTGANGTSARVLTDPVGYKKYKLTTAYLEAPFELRYFADRYNRDHGFKMSLGLRVGTLIGAHTKAVETISSTKTVFKTDSRRYFDPYRFAVTARVGYGIVSVFGSYNINTLFKAGAGPSITPYSVGICFSGL